MAVLTVWTVITVTFFVMHAVPGGPFMSEKAVSEAAQAALEAKYGLDKPLMVQYLTYLKERGADGIIQTFLLQLPQWRRRDMYSKAGARL